MNLFIDTNVFLSFYHLSNDDLEEMHKLAVLLDEGEVVLWLPEQVMDEFSRNRENKISDAIKRLKEQQRKLQFPQICKDYKEYSEIRELQKNYEKKIADLLEKVLNDVENHTLKADEKIEELFEKAYIIQSSTEIVEKARLRMDVGNPPGKSGSLGDAINWECLLSYIPENKELHLVADDQDYYSVLDESAIKDFLYYEWVEQKKSDVFIYRRLSQFFREYYPDIKLASELEKNLQIKELVGSYSFARTHSTISKLSKYAEFNKLQAEQMVEAALTNDQINWIICDEDVYIFYKNLIETCGQIIDSGLQTRLQKELGLCENNAIENEIDIIDEGF